MTADPLLLTIRQALEDAADTFAEMGEALRLLGHPTMTRACDIAEVATREALAACDALEARIAERDRFVAELKEYGTIKARRACEARSEAAERALHEAKQRIHVLEDQRRIGQTPHRCLNPDCGITQYGVGYQACPSCGGTDGRAVLSGLPAGDADD